MKQRRLFGLANTISLIRCVASPLTGVLFLAALLGCSSARHAASEGIIRVMSWNIHHGEGADKTVDIDRIAKIILSEKPDVVALQEVDRGVARSGRIDIIVKLAELTDMTYAFGKTIDIQGGEYGNAFLTRYPILEERNLHYRPIRPGEQRALHQMILDVKGQEIVVANTHLDSNADDLARISSIDTMQSTLRAYSPRPVIVCGDFNDVPQSRVVTNLTRNCVDCWTSVSAKEGYTYPSVSPRRRIDYVLLFNDGEVRSEPSAPRLQPLSARVVPTTASDHLPLVVIFKLRNN